VKIEEGPKQDKNCSYQLLSMIDRSHIDEMKNIQRELLLKEEIPCFYTIEIETFNRCNNVCSFCPVNKNDDSRIPCLMDENLFKNIINQLKAIDYRGYISLFSNNEPLLDKRIFSFIKYAKENLPNAKHALYTNGILLNKEKFMMLVNQLDFLVIDNYDDNFELIPPVREIVEAKLPEGNCDVKITLRKQNQVLDTRGGEAHNRDLSKVFSSGCILPYTQMVVRPDGKVSKCCQDPLGRTTLGDLTKETVLEVWHGERYQELRRELYHNGRKNIKGCQHCDLFGLCNYMPSSYKAIENFRMADVVKIQKKLGPVYVFDVNSYSIYIINKLKEYGTEIDGVISNGNNHAEGIDNVDLQTVFNRRGFIIVPHAYYNNDFFDLLSNKGYQYGRDYIIYPTL
jgi:radical SAM protein with 4Fe4S-binding SPASM domain